MKIRNLFNSFMRDPLAIMGALVMAIVIVITSPLWIPIMFLYEMIYPNEPKNYKLNG